MTEAIEASAFESVSRHARFAELVALARAVALRAARARALVWQALAEAVPEADRGALTLADAATELGNAWTALERGPTTREEHALLRALWAHALAESRPASAPDEDALAAHVVWLAAFTPFDATALLDRALGDAADSFWPALGERLRQLDAGEVPGAGRAEAVAAAVALRSSSSPAAAKEASRLASRVTDPVVLALLAADDDSAPCELEGEIAAAPRHPAVTVLLAVTGILFVSAFVRLVARVALAYRRPAEVTVTPASVRVRSRTLVLGRKVRDRDVLLARPGIARAIREVRYARSAFYAGLLSLAVGSLIGVRVFVDGVRSASPSLLFVGLAVVAAGIALDFALGSLGGTVKGRCRIVLVNRDGTSLCVRDVDGAVADAALARLTPSPKQP
jgi:hypothetical protein